VKRKHALWAGAAVAVLCVVIAVVIFWPRPKPLPPPEPPVEPEPVGEFELVSIEIPGVEKGLNLERKKNPLGMPGVRRPNEDVDDRKSVVSPDGQVIAYRSLAQNLVENDTNRSTDIFLFDSATRKTKRVSIGKNGTQANGDSDHHGLSKDGKMAVFSSTATNLVDNDTNGVSDVFVHDTNTGETTRVSVGPEGVQANGASLYPSLSHDARFVVFSSDASNLVAGDTNGFSDIFVHDRQTKSTTRVNVGPGGVQANEKSTYPSISADGRFVVFTSKASNLVEGDTNNVDDVFIHDRQTQQTSRVSVGNNGTQANDQSYSYIYAVTHDGLFVVFTSKASNLADGDSNESWDVFVRDRVAGTTQHISRGLGGAPANGHSLHPSISTQDGRYVIFYSLASNLVPGDTNEKSDVFRFDREKGTTKRVSVDSAGRELSGGSDRCAFSADGGVGAFASEAPNVIPTQTENFPHVYRVKFERD
jgi:hypothetical protein